MGQLQQEPRHHEAPRQVPAHQADGAAHRRQLLGGRRGAPTSGDTLDRKASNVTKSERAAHVLKRLGELYPDPPIPLDHKDAYTLLVAVLLSAQCTDVRVNQVTPKLFALADNPRDMGEVPVKEIEAIVKPCGLGPQ